MMAMRRKYLGIGLAGLLILVAVAVFIGLRAGSEKDGSDRSVVATASPVPAVADATPSGAPPARIVIPRIGVDAPITTKGMGANGGMEPPDGPEDVAWYGFTARPGSGSNAVFSAHVDYHGYGPAVFADLKKLEKGDLVEVHTADGAVYRYEVTLSLSYPAETAPFEEIVGPTSREVITLITCTGSFDQAARQYSHRLVVRAERV
jgi:LPXTG-site transpeptidase (sortase) family protein